MKNLLCAMTCCGAIAAMGFTMSLWRGESLSVILPHTSTDVGQAAPRDYGGEGNDPARYVQSFPKFL